MGVREFIRDEVFAPRLRTHGVLIVYDPDCRYRRICQSMASDRITVVDASESSIESRDAALKALPAVAQGGAAHRDLLIYVPKHAPVTDEARQVDPFSVYGVLGAVFPDGDGHSYLSLCLRAKPDHATETRRLAGRRTVQIDDVVWPARADYDIASGSTVVIAELDGNVVTVRPA